MILPPPKRPRSSEENVLPLINIVFLLLIFFMLAGVIAQRPPFALTAPSTAQTAGSARLQPRVLSVAPDGRLALDGKVVARDQLAAALTDWPANTPLQIRADGHIKASALTELFATLRAAGIDQVKLLTRHQDE